MKMKFVFFGTPEPAVEILDALRAAGLMPSLIVTNPDRPQGRKMILTPPPVKEWAIAHRLPYIQPEKLDSALNLQLKTYNFELFVVVAYGAILPKALLDIPKRGAINVHYSLLPKHRGASPVESQILVDDRGTGVSLMLIDEKLDHGSLLTQKRVPVPNWPPSAQALRTLYNAAAGPLLAQTMQDWSAGKIQPVPQDESKATYTRKFTKADGEINLNDDSYKNFLKIQAFAGSIGTYFFVPASYSPFPKGSAEPFSEKAREGFKSSASEDLGTSFKKGGTKRGKIRVIIKSAEFRDGALIITRVVPEGKKEMLYDEFLRGFRIKKSL